MQESSESVGGGLFETLGGCSEENYRNQVWSGQWRRQQYKLLCNQGKSGHNKVAKYDSRRIW